MRRSVTPISHAHNLLYSTRCTCGINIPTVGEAFRSQTFFALKSTQRSSDRIRVELFGAYTLHTNVSNDLTLAGMAGVVSLTSSVGMVIGPSPRRLIVSKMGSLSSRERKAVIQDFLDSTTNFPPQSAQVKWWKPNRGLELCTPTSFIRSQTSKLSSRSKRP